MRQRIGVLSVVALAAAVTGGAANTSGRAHALPLDGAAAVCELSRMTNHPPVGSPK